MSTWLRLLYIAFWMNPVQRACTVLGLGIMAGVGGTLYSPTPVADLLIGFGCLAGMAAPALLGGAFWRALSAPRVVSLAPRGRVRLLLGVLAVAATVPLASLVFAALYSLGTPQPLMGIGADRIRLVLIAWPIVHAVMAIMVWVGLWLVGCFVVSRSPLAMLLALIAGIATWYVLWRFDFITDARSSRYLLMAGATSPRALLMREWRLLLPLAACGLFAAWYLRARRIRPPGWLLPGGQSVLAAVALSETSSSIPDRQAALERLLLGGSSVVRLIAQWLLVYAALLLLLMLMARQGEDQARAVAHIQFATLMLVPAIVAAQSVAIVRRARAIWLVSGFSRLQLRRFTGRTLLKLALGMALLFAGLLLLLWNTQPWHPALAPMQMLALCLVPGLFASASAALRPAGQAFYWPLVAMVLLSTACFPLIGVTWWTDADPAVWNGSSAFTLWTGFATAAILAQVLLGRRRWLVDDLPRATSTSAAS